MLLGPIRFNELLGLNSITIPQRHLLAVIGTSWYKFDLNIYFFEGLKLEELEDPNYSLSRWPLINSDWNETEFDWQRFAVLMHLNHDLHVLLDISVGGSPNLKMKRVFVIEFELKFIQIKMIN